jgi:hypothetical protein
MALNLQVKTTLHMLVQTHEASHCHTSLGETHKTAPVDIYTTIHPNPFRPTEMSTKSRTTNFTPTEDKYLSSSWLEISTDTLRNNSQKKNEFWEQIAAKFNQYSGSSQEVESLSNRQALSFIFVWLRSLADTIKSLLGGMSFKRRPSSLPRFTTKSRGIPLLELPNSITLGLQKNHTTMKLRRFSL